MNSHHCAIPDKGKGLLAALAVVLFRSGFNIVSRLGAGAIFTPFDLAAALTWAIFGLLLRRWQIRPQLGILGVVSFSAIGGLLILDEQLGSRSIVGIVVVSVGAMLGALPPGALDRLRGFRVR